MPSFPKPLSTLIVGSGRLRPAKPLSLPAGIVLSGKQRPLTWAGFQQPSPAVYYPSPDDMPSSGLQSNNSGSGNGKDNDTTPVLIIWQPSYPPNHPQRFQAVAPASVPQWQFEYLFRNDRRHAFFRDAMTRNTFREERVRYLLQQYEARVAAQAAAAREGLSVDIFQPVQPPSTTREWSIQVPTIWKKPEEGKIVISATAGIQPPTPPPRGDDDNDKDKTAPTATADIDTAKDNNSNNMYTKGAQNVPLPNLKLNLAGHPATFGCGPAAEPVLPLHYPDPAQMALDRVPYRGWLDRYLPNLRLRLPDHPATRGVDAKTDDPRDLSSPQARVFKYDWELERAITVRTRDQKERDLSSTQVRVFKYDWELERAITVRQREAAEERAAAEEREAAKAAFEARMAQEALDAQGLEIVRAAREKRLAREREEARKKQEARDIGEDEKKYIDLPRKGDHGT